MKISWVIIQYLIKQVVKYELVVATTIVMVMFVFDVRRRSALGAADGANIIILPRPKVVVSSYALVVARSSILRPLCPLLPNLPCTGRNKIIGGCLYKLFVDVLNERRLRPAVNLE
ncbi:hypothetical protein A4A49_19684 [Nicotiana attenuata]|uniref:Uncharacterized protein n=1 Tax=Nicotiana attenuata TaxID=49451 RepID=A0A1J6KTZ5_NICAT|nr:hypothetical protein A4A49_19684 [Nicotiana attenuata]